MEDEDAILGPNGLPLVDAELEVLLGEYEQWQEQNAGEDMPLADYAVKFFFADCTTVATTSDNDNNTTQDSLYPDLGQDAAPSVVVMDDRFGNSGPRPIARDQAVYWDVQPTGTEVARTRVLADSVGAFSTNSLDIRTANLPVLNKAVGEVLPVLTRTFVSAHRTSFDKMAARASNPMKGKLPVMERIQVMAEMPALEPIATAVGIPALEPIPKAMSSRIGNANLPALESFPGATSARVGNVNLSGFKPITTGTGMPALKLIPKTMSSRIVNTNLTVKGMPALESIPKAMSSRIGSDNLPTLERVTATSDGPAMSALSIGATMDSVRGHGMDAMFRPRRDASNPPSFRSMLAEQEINVYDSLFDRDDDALDTVTRASLAHSFSVIRDQFASDSEGLASAVSSSRGELLSFAAELRSALAGVETSDASRAAFACCNHLSGTALARVAGSADTDAGRASFVASAYALANAIVAHHDNDAEVRSILVGIKKPDIFINTLYEAWKRLVNQAIKDTQGIKTPDAAYQAMSVVFAPIRSGVVLAERKKPNLTRGRMLVWGYIAGTIIKKSLDNMIKLPVVTTTWSHALYDKVYAGFDGPREDSTDPKPNLNTKAKHVIGNIHILAQTTIAKKVLKGLQIVAKGALAGIGDNMRKELAIRGTEAFMHKYLQKQPSVFGLYMSAVAGIELMHKVVEVHGYNDVYDNVIVTQIIEILGIAASDTELVTEV